MGWVDRPLATEAAADLVTNPDLVWSCPCYLGLHWSRGRGHLGDLHAERLEGRVEDRREARERLDRVAQHFQRDAGTYGQRRLLQPLAGLRSEGIGAGQADAVAEQGQEAVRLGVGVGV